MRLFVYLALSMSLGCAPAVDADADGDNDAGGDANSAGGDASGPGGDASGAGDTDAAGDPGVAPGDTAPPGDPDDNPPPVVRFIALGDGGEGNLTQFEVAAAAKTICDQKGCDFALYLGDNFYDTGVAGVDDNQFDEKFEAPYADLDMPFYVVLGNHDYGSTSLEQYKGAFQVQYTDISDKWTMPDEFYAFRAGHVDFLALDTNAIMLDWTADAQGGFVDDLLTSSTAGWRIAFGHHPYLSNGQHGNAGNYEGCGAFCPVVNGAAVQNFFEDHLCGNIDLYINGHDHNRQWLAPTCGVELIVSGAAAKLTDLVNRDDNPTLFEEDQTAGFLFVEIDGDTLVGEMYDSTGAMQYTRTVQR